MTNRETLAFILGNPAYSLQEVSKLMRVDENYITFANSHALGKLMKLALETREAAIARKIEKEVKLRAKYSLDAAVFETMTLLIDNDEELLESVKNIVRGDGSQIFLKIGVTIEDRIKGRLAIKAPRAVSEALLERADLTELIKHYRTKVKEDARFEAEEAAKVQGNPCAMPDDPCLTDAERNK